MANLAVTDAQQYLYRHGWAWRSDQEDPVELLRDLLKAYVEMKKQFDKVIEVASELHADGAITDRGLTKLLTTVPAP